MPYAALSIDLEANLAKFQADMGRATASLDKLAGNARKSFASVGDVFAGSLLASAAEESLRGLVQLFPRLIDGVAAFQDLSEETGASAEALAGFQTAADVSGVAVADLARLMVKLTGNLSKLTDEGKGAGAALKALGLDVKAFRALSPDQQIKTLAETFAQFADGSGKTAVALGLFGRQGAQVLKFFKEYQAQGSAAVRLTAEQIAQADSFVDSNARLFSEIKQGAQIIALQALPAINALGQGFFEGTTKLLGFRGAAGALRADSAILDFAEGAAVAVGTVAEAITGLVKLARAVGGSFQAVGADIALPFEIAAAAAGALQGRTVKEAATDVVLAIQARNRVVAEANQRYVDLWTYDGTAITQAIRKSFAEQRTVINADQAELARMRERAAGAVGKKELALTLPDADAKRADEQFGRFMAQILERKTLAEQELATNQKLTESERFRIDVLARLDDANNKLTPQRKERIRAALDEALAVMGQVQAQQELAKARAAAEAIESRQLATLERDAQARIANNEALREQVQAIGLTGRQMEDLAIARLQDKAALEAQTLAMLRNADASAAQIAASEQTLELLRQEIDLRRAGQAKAAALARDATLGAQIALDDYLASVVEAGTATRYAVGQSVGLLEDELTLSLKRGRLDVSRTIDFMISEFLRLQVVKPLLSSLFSAGGSALTSLLGTLFGGGLAAANGAAFDRGVVPFARGGVFDSPRLFRYAQGGAMATGVLGEAGPEAVLPLSRGTGGRLGVRAQGMGGTVVINQVFNFGQGTNRNELSAWAAGTKQQTLAAVAEAQRRGYGRGSS